MTKEEFLKEVRSLNPCATEDDVFRLVGSQPFSDNLVRYVADNLDKTAIAVAPIPTSPSIAKTQPATPTKAKGRKTSKLEQQQAERLPLVQGVQGVFQAGFGAAVAETVDFIQAAKSKTAEVEDQLAQELAALIDPTAVKGRVLIRAAKISQDAALNFDTANLFAGVDEQLDELATDDDLGLESIREYIELSDQRFVQSLRAIAPQA
jgi:hypothetical protein